MSGDHRHYSNLMAIASKDCIVVFVSQSRRIRLHSTQPRVECLVWLDCAAAAPMILKIIDTGLCWGRHSILGIHTLFSPSICLPVTTNQTHLYHLISTQQRPLSVLVLEMPTNLCEVSQLFFAVKLRLREGPLVALTARHHIISNNMSTLLNAHVFHLLSALTELINANCIALCNVLSILQSD